jgi:hypothetical protein
MSFFDTEEVHAVMLAYAADRGGLPWRDDTGICSCFAPSWVCVDLAKVLACQAWARGVLLFR